MNVFGTGLRAGSSLDEPLVASLQPEAVDVSPAVGFDERAIWVSTMNFIAQGSWNFVDQAVDVEHVVHHVRTVGEEGAG
jgi:hypothetical protein